MADPYTAAVSAVGSVANISIKIFQISYEIKAVDEKARDLLETTQAITKTLDTARTLYNQKSDLFNDLEQSCEIFDGLQVYYKAHRPDNGTRDD